MARTRLLPRLSDTDLGLLRVFVTVVECGGFTAARSELNVSQSTISLQVAGLETRFGVRLCERGRRGFRLTVEGQKTYDAAIELFRAVDEFRSEVGAMRGRLIGDLHLGIADATITNPDLKLDGALARFRQDAPDLHLHLHVGTALELEVGLVEGRFNAVIGPLQKRRPELTYWDLPSERQELYCGSKHPLFELAPDGLTPEQLSGADFTRRGYLGDWTPPHGVRLNPVATTDNMEATARLILGGAYLGYLPPHFSKVWVERGEMRPVLPALTAYDSKFFLAVPTTGRSAALRWFLKVFASVQAIPGVE